MINSSEGEPVDLIERANDVSDLEQLHELVAQVRADVGHLAVAVGRAAWGALNGQPWVDAPERPTADEVVDLLDMTVTPAGTAARDAVLRQSLATLLAALDAANRAALTVWLALVNADDPDRRA